MKRILVLTLLFGVSVGVFALSGCAGMLDGGVAGTSENSGGDANSGRTIQFEIDPPLAAPLGTAASYTVSSDPAGETFESFTVEPDSDVVEVVSKTLDPPDKPSFTVRASRIGVYPVELRGELAGGREVQRTFELEVREVEGIRFQPQGYELEDEDREAPIPYLVDSEAHVSYELVDLDGDALAGARPELVEWKPESALRLERKESGGTWLVFETASEPGVVTLQSTIDDETQKIELITPSMVEDIALAEYARFIRPNWNLEIEGLLAAHIVPVYDGVTILDSSIETMLSSRTPDTCEVVADDRAKFERETGRDVENLLFDDRWPGDGSAVRVLGGDCRLHAEYPAANDGNGAETDITIPVAE